jgi:hypothetical protein
VLQVGVDIFHNWAYFFWMQSVSEQRTYLLFLVSVCNVSLTRLGCDERVIYFTTDITSVRCFTDFHKF